MDIHEALIEIGIQLSAEQNIDELLNLILQNARYITDADAGTLYLKEGDYLRFAVSQNATLEMKMGREKFEGLLSPHVISISEKSMAGWSADRGELINIDDVYNLGDTEYCFDGDFDKKTGYRCQSMLTVPIIDREKELVGVFQLINKRTEDGFGPFSEEDERIAKSLASQAAVSIKNTQLTDDLKSAHLETIYILGQAAEYKDQETGNHIKRVSEFSRILAEGLGLDDVFVEMIYYASPLHDVGKIGIPDNILTKPGKLKPDEWEIMKSHTIMGYNLLKNSPSDVIQMASKVAFTHHERWDGGGYPRGLKGEDIPNSGRIVALTDFFDALTSERPYRKKPFPLPETLRIIKEEDGKHFCPEVTDCFFDSIERIKDIHHALSDIIH